MKVKAVIILLAFFCITTVYGQQTILYPTLKKQIDSLALLDIKAGHDEMHPKSGTLDSLRAVFRKITVSNTVIIKEIFNRYGFLNYDMVGVESSSHFWLMVQHADNDVPFQEAVLQKMKEQVLNKKTNASNFAYLTDRVNVNTGKPQVYGTQLSNKLAADGTLIPKEMIDPQNVNKRRAEIGMESLENYLKLYKEVMTQHN